MATIDPELLKRLTSGHTDLDLAEAIDATHPNLSHVIPDAGEAPTLERSAAPSSLSPIGGSIEPKRLPVLSRKEQRGLPMISPGTPAGSAADYENQLAKLRSQPDAMSDHPTTLGKIGHVLGKIGNIAGDVFAPATMAITPGTDLNRRAQIHQIEPKLQQAKEQEELKGERKEAAGRAERKETSEEEERAARTKNLNEKDSMTL